MKDARTLTSRCYDGKVIESLPQPGESPHEQAERHRERVRTHLKFTGTERLWLWVLADHVQEEAA